MRQLHQARATNGRTVLLLNKANQIQDPTSHLSKDQLSFLVNHKQHADEPQPTTLCQEADTHPSSTAQEPTQLPPHLQSQQQQYQVHVKHYSACNLPPDLHEWAFQLVYRALKAQYEPVWGWSDDEKHAQLRAPSSRFLVAFATPGTQPADTVQHADVPTHVQNSISNSSPTSTNPVTIIQPQPCPQPDIPTIHALDQQSTTDKPSPVDDQADVHAIVHSPLGHSTTHTDLQHHRETAGALPLGGSQNVNQPECHSNSDSINQKTGVPQAMTATDKSGASACTLSPHALPSSSPLSSAAAYVNYRFEEGYYKDPVLYVYEVMVSPSRQRLGLASHLMRLLEEMAWEAGMDRVVLTVLVSNKAALALYRTLKYTLDKASPGSGSGYQILSKENPTLKDQHKKGRGAGGRGKGASSGGSVKKMK